MTDNEIIQALECCGDKSLDCTTCPYYDNGQYNCTRGKLFKDAVAAINRQQAEIERLEKEVDQLSQCVLYHDGQIADAIKEFADKIKADAEWICDDSYIEDDLIEYVDNLLKEKVGE